MSLPSISSLQSLLEGPIKSIYTPIKQALTPNIAHAYNLHRPTEFNIHEGTQRRGVPYYAPPKVFVDPDPVTPDHHDRIMPNYDDYPDHTELVDLYNDISYRGIAESYDLMDSQIYQATHCPDGVWGISATANAMSDERRVQFVTGLNLNRTKQHQTPLNWHNGAVLATENCHVIGHADLDTVGVKCYAGVDAIVYQGSEMLSFTGDEDSSVHQIVFNPFNNLTLGYEYQAHPQAIEQSFTTTTKLDTVGLGLKTSYVLGNIIVTGKVSKRFYFFNRLPFHQNPFNYLYQHDDTTVELQEAEKTLARIEVHTSTTFSSTGEIGVNVSSRIGWKAIREFALTAKLALAQGMCDFQGMFGFLIFGRRARLFFDQDGSLQLNSRFDVFQDGLYQANVNFEFNPIEMVYSGQVPTLSAQLNANVDFPRWLSSSV